LANFYCGDRSVIRSVNRSIVLAARFTVVSKIGKEATIGILGEGNFFGEGSLAGQTLRMGSAAAVTDCEILRIEKKAMMGALHREHAFSDMFVAYLLARNIRYEEDRVDQLFNSSEKRLARVLLMLAHFGKAGVPETVVPKISQETLAEMVGTTRSRVSFFMNRFRKLGFIHYAGGEEGGLQVQFTSKYRSPRLDSAPKFQSPAQRPRATHAFAGSKPESSGIFIATTTSSKVAVLRTLPEMPMSASERKGCCSASKSSRSPTL
jgi:CRP-like cAMP-binding protein